VRAERTASIIAEAIGMGPVVVLDGLMERCAGEWEGRTREEIEAKWPGYIEGGERPFGFESEDSLAARGIGALDEIAAMVGDGEVLAVSHSGLIYSVERALGTYRGRLPNLSGIWVVSDAPGEWTIGDRVDLLSEFTTNDIE
jgi:probable phosphoglycerate mutase